ncbi:MAG: T9SS type A sorting domain-containing protein [Bacteroidales bacterium]|nr:T9SS type A sorting domain-containing protein [Bacteroidales bacterium]
MKKLVMFIIVLSSTISMFSQTEKYRALEIDFETDTFGSYITFDTSKNNIWQIGIPQKTFINSALWNSKKCIITDTVNNYPVNNYSVFTVSVHWPKIEEIVSPIIDFGFHHKFYTDSATDGGRVEVSFNGEEWFDVWNKYNLEPGEIGEGLWYISRDKVKSLDSTGFSGNISTWKEENPKNEWEHVAAFYIYPYDDDMVSFYLKFIFASDSIDNNKEGWAIDNICIYYVDDLRENKNNIYFKNNGSFIIYPNPANGNINLVFNNSFFQKEVNYKIVDARGQILEEKSIEQIYDNSYSINLENLLPGIYFLVLSDKKRIITKKFVVN